jgi:hypothetical protein
VGCPPLGENPCANKYTIEVYEIQGWPVAVGDVDLFASHYSSRERCFRVWDSAKWVPFHRRHFPAWRRASLRMKRDTRPAEF